MYDLIVIGGGWAGFNAAVKAKRMGLKTCLVERGELGGTCLNRGCIPTKTLIHSARIYNLVKKSADFGIITGESRIDFAGVRKRADQLIRSLAAGMEFMLKGVDVIRGEAKFSSPSALSVGSRPLEAGAYIIATGSYPLQPGSIKFDGERVISSDEILRLNKVPRSLLVIGGGAIGCEFASLFHSLGAEVEICEKMPRLLPGIDSDISKKLESLFKKRGIKINLGSDAAAQGFERYDKVLLSAGRCPDIQGIGLQEAGVKTDGGIIVDDYLRTNISYIYAAGDCTRKIMLAHFAAYQGKIAASNASGKSAPERADNYSIPNCIFTDPEVASVGLTEEEAGARRDGINVNKFDFIGSGMARILGESEGFLKIISSSGDNRVLGASVIGPRAGEIIGILTLAVSARLKTGDLRNTVFAHPTISEAIGEALG